MKKEPHASLLSLQHYESHLPPMIMSFRYAHIFRFFNPETAHPCLCIIAERPCLCITACGTPLPLHNGLRGYCYLENSGGRDKPFSEGDSVFHAVSSESICRENLQTAVIGPLFWRFFYDAGALVHGKSPKDC